MSWWQLDSILKEQAHLEEFYRAQRPMACPHDGTPLIPGPPRGGVELYCPNGDFRYPQDYDVTTQAGM